MILKLLSALFSGKAMAGVNSLGAALLAGAFIIYKLQDEGQTYCFSLLELIGLGAAFIILMEINRRTQR